jgi:poly-gamma-glutamate biosynthesis protein PgsC/CapC
MSFEAPLLGLVLSLAYVSLTGLYPGGVIVPSYLVLVLNQPYRVAVILTAALLTLVCYRMASRQLIVFGTRRFVFMVLLGALWSLLGARLVLTGAPVSAEFHIIGWVIPGLVANSCERQGVALTLASLITVTVVTYLVSRILHLAI